MEQVDLLDQSVSDERIAREIAVNLTGPILLTRRLLPLLRCGRNPMIIMVTSGYALLPATRAPTYSATKAGLRSFTMALRLQLHGVGIRVVEVTPTPGRYAGHALCATAEDLAGNAGRPGVARYCAWAGRDTARKGRPAAVADASGPDLYAARRVAVDGYADPRISGAECLNWWGDIGRREALAERHVRDCWIR